MTHAYIAEFVKPKMCLISMLLAAIYFIIYVLWFACVCNVLWRWSKCTYVFSSFPIWFAISKMYSAPCCLHILGSIASNLYATLRVFNASFLVFLWQRTKRRKLNTKRHTYLSLNLKNHEHRAIKYMSFIFIVRYFECRCELRSSSENNNSSVTNST